MNTYNTQCCGVSEIAGLSNHLTPEEALTAFCTKAYGAPGTAAYIPYGPNKQGNGGQRTIYTHYTFTAAIYDKDCTNWEKVYNNPQGVYYKKIDQELGRYFPYGDYLARYIEENKLGRVTTTGAEFNKLAHPDHKVQIWIWTPDQKALYEWWLKKNTKKVAEDAKKALEKAEAEATKARQAYEAAMAAFAPEPAQEPVKAPVKRVRKPKVAVQPALVPLDLNNLPNINIV